MDAVNQVASQTFAALTYCANDPVGQRPFAQLKSSVQAYVPDQAAKVAMQLVAWAHDSVYIYKAAIEGAGKVDAPAMARWLEGNAGSVKGLIYSPFEASTGDHFLLKANSLVFAERIGVPREDGLLKRVGC
jgi:hypothetical protein